MFWNKPKLEEEKLQNEEKIEVQEQREEKETMVGRTEKKKFYYMIVDKDNNVILDRNGNPRFCTVDEGSAPEWPKEWPQDIVRMARLDKELRVELRDVSADLSKADKKKARQQIKSDAKKRLLKMGEERIVAAKEMQNLAKNNDNKSEQVIDPKIQEAPMEKSVEHADSVKLEETSAPKKAVTEKPVTREKKAEETSKILAKPIPEALDNVDLSVVTACVEKNAEQLSEDITTNVEDLIEVINKNGNENNEVIKSYVEAQAKDMCDIVLRATGNADRNITQKIQKYTENIVSRVNENSRNIGEFQDKILSKVNGVGKRVTDLGESVEGIEGKLSRLEQLDEIAELLRDKGLTISRDIPPVNADEEDIINLVRYSQKITEQLGYAARDLIRKQEAFKSQEESNANEQRMMEQKIAKAHAEGVKEGKRTFVKQLLSKYEDVDIIRESDNNHVHAIWTLLMELGVSIDGEGYYAKGKEIELAASDIEKMMGTYSKLEDVGKYRVVRTGLCFQGEILCKAAFEKVTETVEPEAPKAEKNPETGKEEGEPEAASEEKSKSGR